MRLHRLEITAFGPFADTATVDFDALSAAGLFLLSGATGAGKTSVLDAVCFALYGAVPGERNDAKRLRSDQAGPTAVPRVELEATLGGRRFRIVRSPAWARPKKRGVGTTPQPAAVTVSERLDGGWTPLSTRVEEAGHLLAGLVGMNLTQFTQVAMLPQGRFQAFLRATSDERHRLLQQLFRTERFELVERWLRDHRLALLHRSQGHEQAVDALLHRISETSSAAVPDTDDDLVEWASTLATAAATRASAAAEALPAAIQAESAARADLEAARTTNEHRRRFDLARAERDGLLARADEVARQSGAVDDALRARAVAPLRRVVDAATLAAGGADRRADHDLAAAAALMGEACPPADEAGLARALDAIARESAAVEALVPREAERASLTQRLATASAARATAATTLDRLTTACETAPATVADLRSRRDAAAEAALLLPDAHRAVTTDETRLAAGRSLLRTRNELVAAQLDLIAAVADTLGLHEELVTLQQARLDGMAAEIAHGLAVGGGCCPVCGSEHHPQLASAAPGAPDAAGERALRRRIDDAEFVRHTRAEHTRDLSTRAAVAEQAAGTDDLDLLEAELAENRHESGRLEALAAGLDQLTRRLAEAEASAAEVSASRGDHATRVAALDVTTTALASRLADVTAELARALGDDHADVRSLLDHLTRSATALAAARDSAAAAASARRSLVEAEHALTTCALEAGFPDATTALAAVRSEVDVLRLREEVAAHHRGLATASAVLDDPALAAAASGAAPDLPAAESRHADAADALARIGAAVERERMRQGRLAQLHHQLVSALAAWAPVRADLETAAGLASFVEGKAPDNRLQMRLSAYVLAYRLAQVVAAANARLATMSDQRYSLEHTGRRGTGERRGGLSLLVRDDWSGETRDPATLSGGETFVVSLALALGLADVITHEAGGAALDTLFVDEGFGSLDADTLDDVMDTLDSLRDGGRVVGVVSHVAEMRDRIPTQLVVDKARSGSTVRLAL